MIDRYTKLVLTLIAGALIVLAGERALSPALALTGDSCTRDKPCFVAIGFLNTSDEYVLCRTVDRCATK